MWTKIFYFLAIFSYLNLLFYQAGVNSNTRATNMSTQYFTGDSLLEFVLDDVLDIPIEIPEKDSEVQFDDYRIFNFNPQILSVFIFVLGLVYSALSILKQKKHPLYSKKNACLSGYYQYLYRYSLF
jgi:uncharacterized membrane protein